MSLFNPALLVLIIWCTVIPGHTNANTFSHSQLMAMESLFNSTHGELWTWKQPFSLYGAPWNFSIPQNPCSVEYNGTITKWQGITCMVCPTNTSQQCLNFLNLQDYNLNGSIPSSIGALNSLTQLILSENTLTGSLPSGLFRLNSLNQLNLKNNLLSGTLSEDVVFLERLSLLLLAGNYFHGSIPSSVTNISTLQQLNLYDNLFSHSIPAELSQWSSLTLLQFSGNMLTGSVPASLGAITTLTSFSAYVNYLTGNLPSTIGNLKLLTTLGIMSNLLNAPIPASVGNCSALQQLNLRSNYIGGTLPASIGSLAHLNLLEVQANQLSGSLPSTFKQLQAMSQFYVFQNFLSGSLVDIFDPTTQVNLTQVQVNDNQFTGSLPVAIFGTLKLSVFTGSLNCFEGSIPSLICGSRYLSQFVIDGGSAATSCRQPIWPGQSATSSSSSSSSSKSLFATYTLPKRHLTGTIPSCLLELPYLEVLHLSGNLLTGSFPSTITISSMLSQLVVSHNQLTGAIPMAIQEHTWIDLDLSYNKFIGTIDSFHGQINNESSIMLNLNRLSGSLPQALTDLQSISILDGNLYQCTTQQHETDLPTHDPNADLYSCGSNVYNGLLYAWIGLVALVGSLLGGVSLWYRCHGKSLTSTATTVKAISGKGVHASFLPMVWRLWCQCWHAYAIETTPHDFGWTTAQQQLIQEVGATFTLIRQCFIAWCVLSLVMLLPIYLGLHRRYQTYDQVYAWQVSAAYLQGMVPAYVLLCLWVVWLLGWQTWIWYLYRRAMRRQQVLQALLTQTEATEAAEMERQHSREFSGAAYAFDRTLSNNSTQSAAWSINTDEGRSNGASAAAATSMALASMLDHSPSWRYRGYLIVLIGLNIGVVAGANAGFVYVTLTYDTSIVTLMQIGMAAFKLLWTRIAFHALSRTRLILPRWSICWWLPPSVRSWEWVLTSHPSILTGTMVYHVTASYGKLWLLLCNNVIIPILTASLVNHNCFYDALVVAQEIKLSTDVSNCIAFTCTNQQTTCTCTATQPNTIITTFPPPYTYSFQCLSSILVAYAPVFVIMALLDTFLVPLKSLLGLYAMHWLESWRYALQQAADTSSLAGTVGMPSSSASGEAAASLPSSRSSSVTGVSVPWSSTRHIPRSRSDMIEEIDIDEVDTSIFATSTAPTAVDTTKVSKPTTTPTRRFRRPWYYKVAKAVVHYGLWDEFSRPASAWSPNKLPSLINVDRMLTPLINEAAVMVTWAVLIPSLTPLLCLAGIVRSWHLQAGLGHILTMKPRRIPMSTLATTCLIPLLTLFLRAMGPMYLVSAVVCSWMLWDTYAGDPATHNGDHDNPWWIILAMVVPTLAFAIAGTYFFNYQPPPDASLSDRLGLLAASPSSSTPPPRWMTGASRDGMEFASFPSPRHVVTVTSPINAMATPNPSATATMITVDNPLQTAEHRSSTAKIHGHLADPAAATVTAGASAIEDDEAEALGTTTPGDHEHGSIVEL